MRAADRFQSLDAVRGVCALMVVGFHLNAGGHLQRLFANGYVGVDFFFVLSGFIIASAYGRKVSTLRAVAAACVRRFGRLYPLHAGALGAWLVFEIVATVVGAPGGGFHDKFSLGSLGENILLVQGFTTQQESWNYTAWSISLELWLNVAYFLLVMAVGRFAAAMECLIAAALTAVGVWGAATLADSDPGPEPTVLISVAHYALGFFAGTLLFRAHGALQGRGWRPPVWLTFAVLGVGVAPFLLGDRIPDLGMIPIFSAVVLVFAFDVGPVARVLAGRGWQWIGTVSYSIYLIHPFFTIMTAEAIEGLGKALGQPAVRHEETGDLFILGGPWAMDLALLACLAMVVLAASLTFRLIEDPARRFFNGVARRI